MNSRSRHLATCCFGEIFDRHADEILRYVYARLGPGLAEEADAFRSRGRHDPRALM